MRSPSLLALSFLTAAAFGAESRAATTPDTLGHLREVMHDTITSDAQDAELWSLTQQVAAEKKLVGWTRDRVVAMLGPATPCGPAAHACDDGMGPGDVTYRVGRLRPYLNGGTPFLIVDYDGDVVVATRARHDQ